MAKSQELIEIENGIHFGASSQGILEVTKEAVEPDSMNQAYDHHGKPWSRWGINNDHAQKVIDENMQETASAGALRFKRSAHYGKGLFFYKTSVDKKGREQITVMDKKELPPEMREFMRRSDIENFSQGIIADFEWWNQYYCQYILDKAGKVYRVKWQRAKDVRKEKRDRATGEIKNFYLSGSWPDPQQGEYARIPAYDRFSEHPAPNGIYCHCLVSIDKDYYITPEWQSNMKWLQIARRIPDWILSNINNSINIKYHVKIPQEYFEKLHPRERYANDQEWEAAMKKEEKELKENIDKMLTGTKNVSKVFYSKIALDEEGKPYPGWEIIVLENKIQDGAWLNAYGTAAAAICTAHGVQPSLAGLILSNGLGTGSASDTREQFNLHMQLYTVVGRQTTLEWFDFVKERNGWPDDINIGYRDIILQTMDKAKSGNEVQNEQSPTSDKPESPPNNESTNGQPD